MANLSAPSAEEHELLREKAARYFYRWGGGRSITDGWDNELFFSILHADRIIRAPTEPIDCATCIISILWRPDGGRIKALGQWRVDKLLDVLRQLGGDEARWIRLNDLGTAMLAEIKAA